MAILIFFLLFSFFLSWPHCGACEIEPRPSGVNARSPNHWTAREFPQWQILVSGWFRIPAMHSVYTEVANPVFPSEFCTFV